MKKPTQTGATTFGALIPGQKFTSGGAVYIKASERIAYPLNSSGIAITSKKASFEKDARVWPVR